MPWVPDPFDQVLTRIGAGWTYEPGPRTRRIQAWSLTRTFDPVTRAKGASIRVTAAHPDTEDWNVVVLFMVDDGIMRVREVTVAPSKTGDPHVELTASIMRRVGTQEIGEQVHWLLKSLGTQMTSARSVKAEYRTNPRPGRRGRGDRYYAEVAEQYFRHLDKRAPVQALAEQLGVSPTQARDLVHAARQRGLLTGGGTRGRRGGVLTQKALELLARTS